MSDPERDDVALPVQIKNHGVFDSNRKGSCDEIGSMTRERRDGRDCMLQTIFREAKGRKVNQKQKRSAVFSSKIFNASISR